MSTLPGDKYICLLFPDVGFEGEFEAAPSNSKTDLFIFAGQEQTVLSDTPIQLQAQSKG